MKFQSEFSQQTIKVLLTRAVLMESIIEQYIALIMMTTNFSVYYWCPSTLVSYFCFFTIGDLLVNPVVTGFQLIGRVNKIQKFNDINPSISIHFY